MIQFLNIFLIESNATEVTELVGKMARETFHPKQSLAYLMFNRKLLVGGALISVKHILSFAKELQNFINDRSYLRFLHIGLGKNKFRPLDENHYSADDVVEEESAIEIYRRLAIVTVSISI